MTEGFWGSQGSIIFMPFTSEDLRDEEKPVTCHRFYDEVIFLCNAPSYNVRGAV